MHSAPHRNNSDFQLRYFIAGSCKTADAAWNLLYEQKIDLQIKVAIAKANMLRRKARKLDLAQLEREIKTEQDRLRFEAEKIEFESGEGLQELSLAGAEKELATIIRLMEELEPHRKYKHLPLLEATEASQQDEWREEFKYRIENYLVSQGTVPHDQLDAMRSHPDFKSEILPHLTKTMVALENASKTSNAVSLLTSDKKENEALGE